jgi:hypothetical protein
VRAVSVVCMLCDSKARSDWTVSLAVSGSHGADVSQPDSSMQPGNFYFACAMLSVVVVCHSPCASSGRARLLYPWLQPVPHGMALPSSYLRMNLQSLVPLSVGQHFEGNTASGASSQHMGNSGHESYNSSRRVSDRYGRPNVTPYDPHRRGSSPDGTTNHDQRFDNTTATGASNQQMGNLNSHNNHSVINYFQRSRGRTAGIISVIVAILIILSVALSITLTENARSSKER